jgi:hypothetical protein
MSMAVRLAAGTIAGGNFVAPVRVLAASFRRFHPDVPFHALVLDDAPPEGEAFRVVTPEELGLPRLRRMLFVYGLKAAAAALKPAFLQYLLKQGHEAALFVDPDMLVLDRLDGVFEEVRAHSLSLTPHLASAGDSAGRAARERQVLLAGTFNGGLVGASNRAETWRFLDWWARRLEEHCVDDPPAGLHFDQRWVDLAAGFVEDLHLIRDPGVNAAYWNLEDMEVECDGEMLRVDGRPCRLFHFSGFDPAQPELVSRFAPGLPPAGLGVAPLFAGYAARLEAAGHPQWRTRRWPWDRYRNGDAILDAERLLYRGLPEARKEQFGDPFATGAGTFHEWLRRPERRLGSAAAAPVRFALRAARYLLRWRPGPPFAP